MSKKRKTAQPKKRRTTKKDRAREAARLRELHENHSSVLRENRG